MINRGRNAECESSFVRRATDGIAWERGGEKFGEKCRPSPCPSFLLWLTIQRAEHRPSGRDNAARFSACNRLQCSSRACRCVACATPILRHGASCRDSGRGGMRKQIPATDLCLPAPWNRFRSRLPVGPVHWIAHSRAAGTPGRSGFEWAENWRLFALQLAPRDPLRRSAHRCFRRTSGSTTPRRSESFPNVGASQDGNCSAPRWTIAHSTLECLRTRTDISSRRV